MDEIPVQEFRRILRSFERELDAQNQSDCCTGVTIPQCHCLLELDREDDITLKELALRLNLDKSTVSRTVEPLVQAGYINRTIPQTNRRTTILSLTESGKKKCQSINSGNDFYFRVVLAALPPELRAPFLAGLEALATSMAERNKLVRS